MPLLDSDIRKLQPAKTKYVKSAGEGLLVEVHPQGYKYFVWQYTFPPGKNGTIVRISFGLPAGVVNFMHMPSNNDKS